MQDKTSVNIELPSNLYEILSSKVTTDRKTSDSDVFILTATMSGSVTQSQTKTIRKSSEPLSIVFSDVPLRSVITVEITISRDNIVLYSGKSQPKTITNVDSTIEVTLSAKADNVGKELPNIKIGVKTYDKTGEVVVIAKGTTATIKKATDDSWNNYNGEGVFVTGREVTLSPFIMGKYEVTQELYQAVMGTNPSEFQGESYLPADDETQGLRPVEMVTWYDAVVFCNELTKKTMTVNDCVYSITGEAKNDSGSITTATVTADHTKKGYRLPTEAEWEFAARGGDPSNTKWGYAYAGVQTEKDPSAFTSSLNNDEKLDAFGWYASNSDDKTHEVGKLTPNTLGLYDMSGNVYEWCYDWWAETVSNDTVKDPLGATSGSYRIFRGGSWNYGPYYCSVSSRSNTNPFIPINYLGFRVCRYQ